MILPCSADKSNASIAIAIMHNCTLDVLQHLIDKGYSVNAKWLNKEPLYYAIQLDRKDLWERLLTAGAECTCVFNNYCSFLNEPKIVEILISKQPDLVNRKNMLGFTALHFAAWYGNIEIACLLVSYGADTTVLNGYGRTALDYCYQKVDTVYNKREDRARRDQIVRLLEEEERAYLVYKGFVIYGREHEIFKQRLPEIKFNNDSYHVVKEVLECVWSRSNYDVFRELMEYLK
jgi:hypothetical protein